MLFQFKRGAYFGIDRLLEGCDRNDANHAICASYRKLLFAL